jgi:hypothetical protein
VVGPLLDHFRHGRRYALAVTMLGRAFLAYVISDHLLGWGLYPAAFGVLALSRAYGVARSAAVPRLLPKGVGLSQVGARASVYGTFAGAVVAPIGLLTFKIGPQWPLRVAVILFIVGMIVSLRLPPRADSDPPEAVPQPWRAILRLRRGPDRPLSGRLVIAALIGSASLRLLYGFLLLFFTFVVMANQLDTTVLGRDLGRQGAVGLIGGALAVGTFLSTAVGSRLRIRRPLALQSAGLTITAGVAVLATVLYSLPTIALLALVTAVFSGIAKLAIDASIQERIAERLRASAFAHSETVLMIAWVIGGGIGLIPLPGRLGVTLAALLAVAAAVRAGYAATRLHNDRLSGRAGEGNPLDEPEPDDPRTGTDGGSADSAAPADPWPDAPTVPARNRPHTPAATPQATAPAATPRATAPRTAEPATARAQTAEPTLVEQPSGRKRWPGRRKAKPTGAGSGPDPKTSSKAAAKPAPGPAADPHPQRRTDAGARPEPDPALAPKGYHVYRPTSAGRPNGNGASNGNGADGDEIG